MDQTEQIAEECLDCGICLDECEFLTRFCENPKELAEDALEGVSAEIAKIAFHCNICGLCATKCPMALDIGKMCMEIRAKAVEEKIELPKNLKFLQMTQKYVNSDAFVLSLPDPQDAQCERVLFPGCHLSGYSPDLVLKTYQWLQERIPDLGIILQCCGAPELDTGDQPSYEESVTQLEASLQAMGASELIVACPNCLYHFKRYAPQFKVVDLYGVLADHWDQDLPSNGKVTVSLHDPCKARDEGGMQEAVRHLISRAGYDVKEPDETGPDTRCCGQGGLVPYVSMKYTAELSRERAEEFENEVVSYCASCREALAPYKPSLHILDLLFNDDIHKAKAEAPHKLSKVKENQAALKEQLANTYGER